MLVSSAQLLLQLDFSIVNIALPAVQEDLGFRDAALQWVVTGYALTFGSLLLLGGRLGDLIGHRRVMVTGLAVFGAASLMGGLASGAGMLIAARLIQGAASALVAPTALAVLTSTFEHDRARTRALGIFQAATAGGATAGIVLGGVVGQRRGWRAVLLVNPPVIVILVILISRMIPVPTEDRTPTRLGILGSVLVTGTLALLIGGMNSGEEQGFAAGGTLALLAAAAILGALFVIAQLRSDHPLLPRALFASRARVISVIVVTLEFGVVVSYVYFISLYLQGVLGFSAILTGVALVPATATVMLPSILISGRLQARIGVRAQLTAGLALMAAGQVVLSLVQPGSSYGGVVVPGLLLTAVGMGISIPAAAFAANSDVTNALRGAAGGMFVTAQQIGAAVGLAALATIAASTTGTGHDLIAGFSRAYQAAAGIALIAALIAALLMPAGIGRHHLSEEKDH